MGERLWWFEKKLPSKGNGTISGYGHAVVGVILLEKVLHCRGRL